MCSLYSTLQQDPHATCNQVDVDCCSVKIAKEFFAQRHLQTGRCKDHGYPTKGVSKSMTIPVKNVPITVTPYFKPGIIEHTELELDMEFAKGASSENQLAAIIV